MPRCSGAQAIEGRLGSAAAKPMTEDWATCIAGRALHLRSGRAPPATSHVEHAPAAEHRLWELALLQRAILARTLAGFK